MRPHLLKVGVKVERAEGRTKAEAPFHIPKAGYHNKLLGMWRMNKKGRGSSNSGSGGCRRNGGNGGARVREGRPCFLSLSLPCPKPNPHPTISDLYNMCIN